ncbi:MAG: S-methyl-5-thioribose-1-phosphate isomerase [Candidatus Scalindua sp. AMX11]|nr:MAG: S-methyl-5-thioribose-1-phosphate isomerase [Candidatus Scalindua sp.]NOG85827.1 S-methyl-5-thioribose-1-phosphate isomerase [Planctomycetota bacterium]RZV96999.1 MAG: S-methyl-5-thioribose-1-phosphate isomerase [Candidatus Scalindua sp. SCAELEC01]TDE66389.1 MAG: S-methyl-5-thioribose-1-phosphate isomerase [Candidatus Scalindua sp. AMX11]GJQ58220.1 MAG: methylthioribose-1-phosphate isomerase [Candidatus Scalindua sp.]
MPLPTIEWIGGIDGKIKIIDQTLLPTELKYVYCDDVKDAYHAIKTLMVRGAPAIGIAAAMGTVLGIGKSDSGNYEDFMRDLKETTTYLASSRPTAVNLFWGLKRMEATASKNSHKSVADIKNLLLEEAKTILEEDKEICRKIGENGQSLIPDGGTVLTHCNAGGLATAYYGTALALIFTAAQKGKTVHVYADETRPLLQGSRLTAWELKNAGIDVTLICDNMAAHTMKDKKVDCIIVGADRIAANGDAANKIGTYGLSIVAKEHHIPFYVAAPASTFDLSLASGTEIPIEERDPAEVTHIQGNRIAPEGVKVFNPAFDVTPAGNIKAIITERGVINDPTTEKVKNTIQ